MYKPLLPPYHQEDTQELYQRCCLLLDHLQKDVDFENNVIRGKYNDFYAIPGDFVRLIINEFGYGYITEVLSFEDGQIKDMLAYMAVIHSLKGHKEGLELVLKLLDITFEIEEWWQKTPKGEPDTFSLKVDMDLSRVMPDTSQKLRDFISHYVYPILEGMKFEFKGILFDLTVQIGGTAKHIILPAEQGLSWNMIRLGGTIKNIHHGRFIIDWMAAGVAPYLTGKQAMSSAISAVNKIVFTGSIDINDKDTVTA